MANIIPQTIGSETAAARRISHVLIVKARFSISSCYTRAFLFLHHYIDTTT
jgi:hypothetical protein